ncbi:MAG: hypothetical protein ACI4TH_01250 [Candidatus Ornithomonoglobus sp.]
MPDIYNIDEIKTIVSDVARQYGVKKLLYLALTAMVLLTNKAILIYLLIRERFAGL